MEPFSYPLLSRVAELYAETSLENVLLLACQHLLEPQKRMFELLLKSGLKPGNCIIVGKNYSTNIGVMEDLKAMNCVVAPFSNSFDPLRTFDDWFEEKLTDFVRAQLSHRKLKYYDKIIVLDDGGFMHKVVNTLCGDLPNIVGIEQTSSGHHKIKAEKVRFESISVARSFQKLVFEAPYIGRCGAEFISHRLKKLGKTDPNILVLGLGPVGKQVACQLLVNQKHRGAAADINEDITTGRFANIATVELLKMTGKYILIGEAMSWISNFDVIIGCAGSRILTEDMIDKLHPQVALISMSSSDREFPSLLFRQSDLGVHADYYRGERCLVNAGFPTTFYGNPHEIPPRQIEFTIAHLYLQLMNSVRSVHPLQDVMQSLSGLWKPEEGAEEWYCDFKNRLS